MRKRSIYSYTCLFTIAGLTAMPIAAQDDMVDDNPNTTVDNDYERPDYDRSVNDSDWFGPQGGEWEVTLAGSGSNDKDFEDGSFNVDVDASYYFSELVSAGVRQNVNLVDTNVSSWNGSTSIFGQLHFGDTPLRPFIGASVGYLYGDDTNDTFFGGPEAGLRYYVKPEAFLFGRASYQFLFESGDDISDQFDDGRFVYTVGVGFTF